MLVYEYYEYTHFFRATLGGAHGNYVILHHANVCIVEDNISWQLGRPFDHNGRHEIGFTDAR